MFLWLLRAIFYLSGLVLLAGIMIFVYFSIEESRVYVDSATLQELENSKVSGGLIHALAIDTDRDGNVDHSSVEKGDDPIIVIKAQAASIAPPQPTPATATGEVNIEPVNDNKFFVFNGGKSLIKHDKNFDGWINVADPIYKDLELVNFRRYHKSYRVTSLKDAGIHAIFFNKEYLDAVVAGNVDNYDKVVGYVVMNDSSKHILKIVPIPLSYFDSPEVATQQ